jgi:hypothetical protein
MTQKCKKTSPFSQIATIFHIFSATNRPLTQQCAFFRKKALLTPQLPHALLSLAKLA